MLSRPTLRANYTLPQKKRRFNPSIFPVDPGSLTLTQCHVNLTFKSKSEMWGTPYISTKNIGQENVHYFYTAGHD